MKSQSSLVYLGCVIKELHFLCSYELMLRCWAQDSTARPTFRQISDEIQTFISSSSEDEPTSDTAPLKSNIDVGATAEFV